MAGFETIGFIGLGVMGEPICRNLVKKSGRPVAAFDLAKEPLQRVRADGASVATTVARVVEQADLVFFCLPSGKHVQALFEEAGGIRETARAGQVFVDLGTSPVKLTRELAGKLRNEGAEFADAPIARTREAAIAGTLSVMVGATPQLFAALEPVIRCFASEVTNCGNTGAGQVAKIMNNMVIFQTVNALSEAYAIAKRSGVDPKLLFETLAKGSADSFALRNHGMKAIIPNEFPERAFSTEYALKDLGYALDLAADVGLEMRGAKLAGEILQEAIDAGHGKEYWPVISKVIDR
jgi:3-hydroxyisobutyrate dehydrogenase-like beta-hydroxyacid dehydrogenase